MIKPGSLGGHGSGRARKGNVVNTLECGHTRILAELTYPGRRSAWCYACDARMAVHWYDRLQAIRAEAARRCGFEQYPQALIQQDEAAWRGQGTSWRLRLSQRRELAS